MKAIQTRYFGPTNHRPSRVKVWAADLQPAIFSTEDLDAGRGRTLDEWFAEAARRFAAEYGWEGELAAGTLPNGDGCHVFTGRMNAPRVVRVFLKITDEGNPYRGAGAWGQGATLEEARSNARRELRECFGPNLKTEERTEEVDG